MDVLTRQWAALCRKDWEGERDKLQSDRTRFDQTPFSLNLPFPPTPQWKALQFIHPSALSWDLSLILHLPTHYSMSSPSLPPAPPPAQNQVPSPDPGSRDSIRARLLDGRPTSPNPFSLRSLWFSRRKLPAMHECIFTSLTWEPCHAQRSFPSIASCCCCCC